MKKGEIVDPWQLEEGDVFELPFDEETRLSLVAVTLRIDDPTDPGCFITTSIVDSDWSAVSHFLPKLESNMQYLVTRKHSERVTRRNDSPPISLTCVALRGGRLDPASEEIGVDVYDIGEYNYKDGWIYKNRPFNANPYSVRIVKRMQKTWTNVRKT